MPFFRKSWHFRTQAGFLILSMLIAGGFIMRLFLEQKKHQNPQIIENQSFIQKIDSLRQIARKRKQIRLYPFNPNYLTDYRAYQLGLDKEAFRRIKTYRLSGKYFHTAEEFKRISGIPDSLFQILKPYIQFPEYAWDTTRKKRTKPYPYIKNKKNFYPAIKKDINTATAEDLKKVYGIGEKLSKRIVKYREKIGGYTIREQLKDIYALSPEAYEELWKHFEIKTPKIISKHIDVNSANIRELQQNPYIDFDLAEKIVEYRELHGKFKNLEDLKKIPGFPVEKYKRIILYLKLN